MPSFTSWDFSSFTLEFLLTNGLNYYFNHRLTNVDEEGHLYGVSGSSGGYAETIFRHAAKSLFEKEINGPLDFKILRNSDFKELSLEVSVIQFLSSNLTILNTRTCPVSPGLWGHISVIQSLIWQTCAKTIKIDWKILSIWCWPFFLVPSQSEGYPVGGLRLSHHSTWFLLNGSP